MQKVITAILLCFVFATCFAQSQKKLSAYVSAQYNKTLYDYTQGNNPWGIGPGLQLLYNSKSMFKPSIEITGDIYLEDNKVLKLNPDGSIPSGDNTVGGMVNIFAGTLFQPSKSIYMSLVAGPSFVGGQTLLGIKPSFGFYFSPKQRQTVKISYINVFNRTEVAREDFGSLSLAVECKLF